MNNTERLLLHQVITAMEEERRQRVSAHLRWRLTSDGWDNTVSTGLDRGGALVLFLHSLPDVEIYNKYKLSRLIAKSG